MTPLNHREIEYYTKKRWEDNNQEIENLVNIFSEWKDENQKNAANNLMDWLKIKGEALFDEDLIMDYGTDCLRIYLMFEKEPLENDKYYDSWEECNLEGVYKFIGRYRRLILTADTANKLGYYNNKDVNALISQINAIKSEVMQHICKGNTMPNRHNAISCIMSGLKNIQDLLNIGEYLVRLHEHEIETAVPHSKADIYITGTDTVNDGNINNFNLGITKLCREIITLMSPFAPYLSDELMFELKDSKCVFDNRYITIEDTIKKKISIPLQINGKTKKVLKFDEDATDENIKRIAEQEAKKYIGEKEYKQVYIKNKIISFSCVK